jgi:polysaccharide biosynthesis/export protein
MYRSSTEATQANGTTTTVTASPALTNQALTSDLLRTMVASEYVAQPGDLYALVLVTYGATGSVEQLQLELVLDEDYSIALPFAGSIDAKGKTFAQLRKAALARVRAASAVLYVDLALKVPAAFRVFVAGSVNTPGYVVANGLMRVSEAIQAAGGLMDGASLRSIRLRRGDHDQPIDLLGFAAGRDPNSNPTLSAGDSIYVPVAQTGVTIEGRVRYPGLYELVGGEKLPDLLELAGGITAGANRKSVTVTRVDETGGYSVTRLDLSKDDAFAVRDGDVVTIPSASDNAPMVVVEGAVFGATLDPEKPAAIPTSPVTVQLPFVAGATVLGLLDKLGGPTPVADASRSFVIRAGNHEKAPVDVAALWKTRDPKLDVTLGAGDRLVVPSLTMNVALRGEVLSPGLQGLVSGLTLEDYVRAAGGATPTRGNLSDVRVTHRDGTRGKVGLGYEPAPGDIVQVGKLPIAAVSDFFGAYVFPITGIAVGVISVVTSVINFYVLGHSAALW